LPKALGCLQTILRHGLDATTSLWPAVRVAYGWVYRAAHILHNATQDTGAAVKRRLLGAMGQHQAQTETLAPAVAPVRPAGPTRAALWAPAAPSRDGLQGGGQDR